MQASSLGKSIQIQGLLGLLMVAVFAWQEQFSAAAFGF